MGWLDSFLNGTVKILRNGAALTTRGAVNFTGDGVTVADDPTTGATTVSVPYAGATMNVRHYGALGDGSTSDTAAFVAALAALNAVGGGTLYCPAATYILGSKITVPSRVTVQGDGYDATILRAAAGAATPWVNVPGEAMVEFRGVADSRLVDLTIDGNAPARTPGSGGDPSTDTIDMLVVFAATQRCYAERVKFMGAGVSATLTAQNPSGPAVLLVAKDSATDLGGQFGTVANQSCTDNVLRDCVFDGNGRCSKALALATDYGWIPPNAPDVPNGGYSPFAGSGAGYTNTTSLRSRAVDSGGDAFVNHVERNLVEGCRFTGTWPLYVVGLQGGGTRHNIVRNCKAESPRALYAFLGDKGDYANVFEDCTTVDHQRDPYTLTTSPMASFVQHSGDFYYGTDGVFSRCHVVAFVGTQVYDVPFAVGEYSVRQRVHGCTVDGAAVTGNLAIGIMLGQGAIDYEITSCQVRACDYGIYPNLGGAPTTAGSGGLIRGNRVDVVNNAILVRVASSTIGGVVTVTDNRCTSSAAGTVGIIDVGGDGSVASAQVHDNYAQGPTVPGAGHVGFVLGMTAGSADGNHVDQAHTGYQFTATHAAHWGERSHATNTTAAVSVVGGATFPVPAGAGLSANDTSHGSRGGGTLHAVAVAGGAAGFVSGSDKTEINALPWTHAIVSNGSKSAASFAVDPSTGRIQTVNISGACTISSFSNLASIAGRRFALYLFNDGTGTITWPTVKWVGGTAPTLSASNVLDIIELETDGSNLYEASRRIGVH